MQNNLEQLQMFPTKPLKADKLTYLQEDFLANLSVLLEKDKDLKTQEAHYFLTSRGCCKITSITNHPYPIYYLKMLKVYITMTITEHLLQSLEFLPTLIIPLSANWLILSGGYPKTGKESISLVDILETQVEEKYFLSTTQVKSLTTGKQKSQIVCNTLVTLEEITKE